MAKRNVRINKSQSNTTNEKGDFIGMMPTDSSYMSL